VLSWGASIQDRIGEHFELHRLYQTNKASMDLRVFLKESNANSLSMATLRGRARSSHPTNSTLPREVETAVMQEMQQSKSGLLWVSSYPLLSIEQPLT